MKTCTSLLLTSLLYIFPAVSQAQAVLAKNMNLGHLTILLCILMSATSLILMMRMWLKLKKALREKSIYEHTYLALFEKAGMASFELDIDQSHITASTFYDQMCGLDHQGKDAKAQWWANIHKDDRFPLKQTFNAHLNNQTESYHATFRYKHAQHDDYHWIEAFGQVIERHPNGAAKRFLGTQRDISQHKALEQQLDLSVKRLEHALSAANAGLWELDVVTNKMTTKGLWGSMLGYSPETLLKQDSDMLGRWSILLHPDDKEAADQHFSEFLSGMSQHYRCEFRMKTINDDWLWVLALGKAISVDEYGLPTKVLGLNLDIHETKTLQFQLEALYQAADAKAKEREALINSIDGIVFTVEVGKKSCIQYVSNKVYELLGYHPEEFNNQPLSYLEKLIHHNDIEAVHKAINLAIQTKESYSLEYRMVTKDGKIRNVYGRGQAVYNEHGTVHLLYGTVLDVTDRKIAERRTKAILETAPDSMLVVNSERKILLINEQTEKLFGYNSAELLNQPIEILLPKRYQANHPEHMAKFFFTPTVRQMGSGSELWAKRKDGTEFPVEISLSPLQTDEGLLVSAAVRDITSRKQADRELLQAKEAAEAATQAKSDFLANMSHEIRTPMNAIIGMSHLALQTHLDPKQKNYIAKVNKSAEDLLRIINDILDFSKIEAGKLDIEHIDFHLKSAIEQFNNLMGIRAAEKDLELLVQIKDGVPSGLVGDPMRLGQILTNLGGNAVKFTSKGEITLMIELVTQNDADVELKFSITDTGIGMSEEQKNKLFQSFSQADTSTTREYGGTGLGLAISKKLTELMGGEIGVSSVLDKGSCFFFTAKFQISQNLPPDNLTLPGHMSKQKVLLVDDNSHARDILANIVSSLGFDADTYADGYTALQQLKVQDSLNQPYKIAIIDWMMPDMNGVTLAQKIQYDDAIKSPPKVIMATSYDKEELQTAVEIARVKLQGIVTKPLTPSNIYNSMLHALGHEQESQPDDQSEYKQQKLAAQSLAGAKLLLVEDNPLNQELAIELLQNNYMHVTLAENGAIALDILEKESFDGVLMDCQMPVMDGYKATIAIRKQSQYAALPIIAMTANVMKQDLEKAIDSGMNDHIGKPLNVTQMFSTMAKWITPQNKVTPKGILSPSAVPTITDLKTIDGINIQSGLKRTQNNAKLYTKLLRRFAESMVDFEQQFDQAEDLSTAKRLAHTLKGNAGNIGADALQQVAEILEHSCDEHNNAAQRKIHLIAVLGQLTPIIAAINQAVKPEVDVVTQHDLLSADDLAKQLQDIRRLLEQYDTEVIIAIENLMPCLPEDTNLTTLRAVQKAANEYDFDNALTLLNNLHSD